MYPRQQHQRSEWSSRSQQPAWAGHHLYHPQGGRQGGPAPNVHRPPPPPVHYPPHHQHRHAHAGRLHHQSPYYHGSARSLAGPPASRQVPQRHMRAPALVSPATQAAVVSSPRTPQSVTSSPREADVRSINQATPVSAIPAAAATAPHASSNNVVTSKPPRPYTEYTMFYQLEREFILHRILTTEEEKVQNPEAAKNQTALFQNDPLMPARFRSLPLRADWYISGKSKKPTKRKHRKSHGKIGFLELTRMIAARWAKVDDETRKYCKMMAAMELVKYKEDMESYNLYKERLSAIGEIPEDMKERILKKKIAAEKKQAGKRNNEGGAIVNSPGAKKSPGAAIKADIISSTATMTTRSAITTNNVAIKLEPIAHNSPIQQQSCTTNLDNDMEQFISSLVRSPGKPTSAKVITPERSPKKRRLFRDRPETASRAAEEIIVPLKVAGTEDDDHIDGIKMTFSGIDENEIAREFSDHIHRGTPPTRTAATMAVAAMPTAGSVTMTAIKPEEPSFDYWDVLVESPGM